MPDVATNRQASYRYHLMDKWEAGLVLTGTEVKSLRGGKAQIKDGYATVKDGEVWLHNVHIPPYAPASRDNRRVTAFWWPVPSSCRRAAHKPLSTPPSPRR